MKKPKLFSLDEAVIAKLLKFAADDKLNASAYIEKIINERSWMDDEMDWFPHKKGTGVLAYPKENMDRILEKAPLLIRSMGGKGTWSDPQHFLNWHMSGYLSKLDRGERMKELEGKDFSDMAAIDRDYDDTPLEADRQFIKTANQIKKND